MVQKSRCVNQACYSLCMLYSPSLKPCVLSLSQVVDLPIHNTQMITLHELLQSPEKQPVTVQKYWKSHVAVQNGPRAANIIIAETFLIPSSIIRQYRLGELITVTTINIISSIYYCCHLLCRLNLSFEQVRVTITRITNIRYIFLFGTLV